MNVSEWVALVVEDDPDGQEVVQRILRHYGIHYDTASDAESALEILKQHPFTIAVIDLALPVMDGWGLIRRIKDNPVTSQIVCVAITAFHSSEVAMESTASGFAAYFPKPLNPTTFVREIEKAVARANGE